MKCMTCKKETEEYYGEGQCHDCWWSIALHNGSLMTSEAKK